MLSQASKILPKGSLGEEVTTLERSNQAPAAWEASVCEIRLLTNAGVNLFCLDQMVNARLKYRLQSHKKTHINSTETDITFSVFSDKWKQYIYIEKEHCLGDIWPETMEFMTEQVQQVPGQPLSAVQVSIDRVHFDLAEEHMVQSLQSLLLNWILWVHYGRHHTLQPCFLHKTAPWLNLGEKSGKKLKNTKQRGVFPGKQWSRCVVCVCSGITSNCQLACSLCLTWCSLLPSPNDWSLFLPKCRPRVKNLPRKKMLVLA